MPSFLRVGEVLASRMLKASEFILLKANEKGKNI
jgi:hypothetical protein